MPNTYHIVLLPGDGIGPEVVRETRITLEALAPLYDLTFDFTNYPIGGNAIDETGSPLPDDTLAACQQADAILLGAVGGPKWADPTKSVQPEQGLLKLRKALGLYANLRPVRIFPQLTAASPLRPEILQGVDLLVVRELTGGLYFGPRQEGGEEAYDTLIYTRPEVERVVRVAARAARQRRGKLTSVDKANVLASSRLWRQTVTRLMAEAFPDVTLEHVLVDAMTMHLIRRPADFDVIVSGNMFGDIITDEAAMLAGSMGMLPSASLGDGARGLYEPIHGSAPDIAGQGVANPLATILSAAMMLRHSLGEEDAARAIESAVARALDAGYRTPDLAGVAEPDQTVEVVGTEAMGEIVRSYLAGESG
ncbi:MAG TPA: 3-isopropylmalate dehydrogenase [Anaerolineae bacterium]|nr:3-isopropylmalate dehydrogenase [Caldilineae bacterium]HID34165.1 3-isopropylmalate dehydrogenase [Anaerolineae bacterium]HIQ12741.1 3-isopropylmalate dehydrogenase [Caldilineales bacterium]